MSRILVLIFVSLALLAWYGPIRNQDIKVYRVSLPLVIPEALREHEGEKWVATALRALPGNADEHSRYQLEVVFNRVSTAEQQKAFHARYEVSLRDAQLLSLEAAQVATLSVPQKPLLLSRLDAQNAAELKVEGRSFRYPIRSVAGASVPGASITGAVAPGTAVTTMPQLVGFAEIGPNEFLTIERNESPEPSQRIVLLRLPSTESTPRSDLTVLPLVELSGLGFSETPAGLALFPDTQTIAIIAHTPLELSQAGSLELWILRLPGALSVTMTPVLTLSALSVLVASVLLYFAFRKKS